MSFASYIFLIITINIVKLKRNVKQINSYLCFPLTLKNRYETIDFSSVHYIYSYLNMLNIRKHVLKENK